MPKVFNAVRGDGASNNNQEAEYMYLFDHVYLRFGRKKKGDQWRRGSHRTLQIISPTLVVHLLSVHQHGNSPCMMPFDRKRLISILYRRNYCPQTKFGKRWCFYTCLPFSPRGRGVWCHFLSLVPRFFWLSLPGGARGSLLGEIPLLYRGPEIILLVYFLVSDVNRHRTSDVYYMLRQSISARQGIVKFAFLTSWITYIQTHDLPTQLLVSPKRERATIAVSIKSNKNAF